MKTYIFHYQIFGIFTEVPTYLEVKASNLKEATKKAQRKFALMLAVKGWGRWRYEKQGWEGTNWKRIWEPPYKWEGKLYDGYEKKPFKPLNYDALVKFPVCLNKAALASVTNTILDVIKQAPAISDMFSTQPMTSSDDFSIPMVFCQYRKPKYFKE